MARSKLVVHNHPLIVALLACCVFISHADSISADLIQLKSGGEIRGRIFKASSKPAFTFKKSATKKERAAAAKAALKTRQEEKEAGLPRTITIKTLSGSKIVVEDAATDLVVKRREEYEIYERQAARVADTIPAQWELAEWCRKNRLKDERRVHLERIVLLDPAHEDAHRALDHVLENGEWRPKEDVMREKGYVLYRGRYITHAELDLKRKTDAQRDGELKWFRLIHQLHGWLNGTHTGRQADALAQLREINDPHAIPGLKKHFSDESSREQRLFYVQMLQKISGADTVAPLVIQSLHDVDPEVRANALAAISPDYHDAAEAHYIRGLRHADNHVVKRSASALQKVGDEDAIPALIEALATKHRYRVRVQDQSVSFGSDGSYSMGGSGMNTATLPPGVEAALRTGQLPFGARIVSQPQQGRTKIVMVQQTHENSEALRTLKALTGQNYGYDKRAWNLWLLASKSGS